MQFREGSSDDPLLSDFLQVSRDSPAPKRQERNGLVRLVAWLWEQFDDGAQELPPSRVFYQFESGSWRTRDTHQLGKVIRCR